MKKELVILVGNIGCGKSTLAAEYISSGYVAIARDYLRYAIGEGKYIFNRNYEHIIWKTEQFMLKRFMELGVNIVVDEVGVSKKLRKGYLKLAKIFNYKTIALVLPQLSMEEAVDRRMKNPHGQYDRNLWEDVWKGFNSIYQEPKIEEGFDAVIKI